MREMTASEASRNFSAMLDVAESGETIVVTRAGRRVATITPAPRANGASLRAVFERWHGNAALDDTLLDRVRIVREAASEDRDVNPWQD